MEMDTNAMLLIKNIRLVKETFLIYETDFDSIVKVALNKMALYDDPNISYYNKLQDLCEHIKEIKNKNYNNYLTTLIKHVCDLYNNVKLIKGYENIKAYDLFKNIRANSCLRQDPNIGYINYIIKIIKDFQKIIDNKETDIPPQDSKIENPIKKSIVKLRRSKRNIIKKNYTY